MELDRRAAAVAGCIVSPSFNNSSPFPNSPEYSLDPSGANTIPYDMTTRWPCDTIVLIYTVVTKNSIFRYLPVGLI